MPEYIVTVEIRKEWTGVVDADDKGAAINEAIIECGRRGTLVEWEADVKEAGGVDGVL